MPSKVSVLIPVYNQPELVIRALDSIPVRDDIEVLVYDDGSTDETFTNIMDYKAKSKLNLNLCTCGVNQGVATAMNWLYDYAKGEYVVALGSDDYLLPEFEDLIDELDGTDMVYFNLEINDGSLFELTPETKEGYCGSTKFIRREFLGDTRCPDKRAAEDYDFYQDLLKKNPTEKFTGVAAKHYNFPREGSLYWELKHGEGRPS